MRRDVEHAQLVRRALARDPAAITELVEYLTPVVQARVARALLRNGASGGNVRQHVADYTQDVFLQIFQPEGGGLASWEPERGYSLKNFVGLIAQRHVVAALRTRRRNPLSDAPMDPTSFELTASQRPSPEASAASRELLQRLLDRVRLELSPRGLEMFYRLEVDGESVEQIHEATGLSEAAIYQWRSRIRKLTGRLVAELEPAAAVAVLVLLLVGGGA